MRPLCFGLIGIVSFNLLNSKLPYYGEESAHDLFYPMRLMVATNGAKKNDKAPQKKIPLWKPSGIFNLWLCVVTF